MTDLTHKPRIARVAGKWQVVNRDQDPGGLSFWTDARVWCRRANMAPLWVLCRCGHGPESHDCGWCYAPGCSGKC